MVGEVAAASGNDSRASCFGNVWHDFWHWVGQGKDNRVFGHHPDELWSQQPRTRYTNEYIGICHGVFERPLLRGINVRKQGSFFGVKVGTVATDDAFAINRHDVPGAVGVQQLNNSSASSASADHDEFAISQAAARQLGGVDESS